MKYAFYLSVIAIVCVGLFLYHKRRAVKQRNTIKQDTVVHCIRFGCKNPEQSIEDMACIYRVKPRDL